MTVIITIITIIVIINSKGIESVSHAGRHAERRTESPRPVTTASYHPIVEAASALLSASMPVIERTVFVDYVCARARAWCLAFCA